MSKQSPKQNGPRRKRASFIAVSLLGGIASAIMLLLLAETIARHITFETPRYVPQKFTQDALKDVSKAALAAPTHITLHLPTALTHIQYDPQPRVSFHVTYEKGHFLHDSEVGVEASPLSSVRAFQKTSDGRLSYDVTYSSDRYGRRIIPGKENETRTQPLFFMGGSFTYGEGLRSDETMAAQAVKFQKKYKTYTYAFHGWGPGNLLRLAHKKDFAEDVPKKAGGKAVYVFIDHHINRVIGSLDLYRTSLFWPNSLPYYYLNTQGELNTKGMHCDRPVRDPIFRFLAQSKLLTWLGLELPRAINEDHLRLVAAMIAQLRDTLRDRVNGMQLYVAFYPGARASKSLIPLLDAQGIPSLDYSEDHFEKFIPEAPRLLDGHPSAAAIRFITHQIVTDLGLH